MSCLLKGLHAVGNYLASVVTLPLEARLVGSWLPPELELAPQDITPPGTHPAHLLFGDERQVHLNWLPFFRIKYAEFAVVVPFVQWKRAGAGYRGPFLFTPLLYLNKTLPIIAGKVLYGFPKVKAVIKTGRQRYEITDEDNHFLVTEADFSDNQAPVTTAERAVISRLIQQPSVSRMSSGRYVWSAFDWRLPEAKLTSINAEAGLRSQFIMGLPSGLTTYAASGVADYSKGGAVRMFTQWTLSLPAPCTPDTPIPGAPERPL
ncbi:MAG TPA: hypothetical protein VGE07_01690 [Herpetosiphonaceae bacterium]